MQRWRRRWFSLKHSGEIPNQFILTYYADRNCRKLKGFINLDDCEQVDLGLKLDERKLKFDHVFDIKTPTRTYYLAADSESEMKSWVNCICKVCGLKSTSDEEDCKSRSKIFIFLGYVMFQYILTKISHFVRKKTTKTSHHLFHLLVLVPTSQFLNVLQEKLRF